MAAHHQDIRHQLEESARVKRSFSDELVSRIAQFAEKSASALRAGGKIVFFGNGGSCADALHLSAELVVRLQMERRGLASLALTGNPSVLTATGNDYGFEKLFARQIESLVSEKDVLVAISTSGNSPNLLLGLDEGRKQGAYLVGLTGETGGAMAAKVDLLLNVPSRNAQRIQESHITIGHIACGIIEQLATQPSQSASGSLGRCTTGTPGRST